VHKLQMNSAGAADSYGKTLCRRGDGRSIDRYEDGGARAGQSDDEWAYFTLLCKLMKDNPRRRRIRRSWRIRQAWYRSGSGLRCEQAQGGFFSGVPKSPVDRIMLQFKVNKAVTDENGLDVTTKTASTDRLLMRLSSRDRALAPTAAGCGLSDFTEGCRSRKYNVPTST